MLVDMIKNVGI